MKDSEDDNGAFTWVTKDGNTASGSEVEMMIAVHLDDVRGVEYDPTTGSYTWADSGVEGPLVIPKGARNVEMETDANGGLVARWSSSLYSDNDEPDRWEVALSPDGHTVDVRVDVDDPGWLSEIQGTIAAVTQCRSIYVHLCMSWSAIN